MTVARTPGEHAEEAQAGVEAFRGLARMYGVNMTPVTMLEESVAALVAVAEARAADNELVERFARVLFDRESEVEYMTGEDAEWEKVPEHSREFHRVTARRLVATLDGTAEGSTKDTTR